MRKKILYTGLLFASGLLFNFSCQKEVNTQQQKVEELPYASNNSANSETPPFNMEIILRGDDNRFGLIKFRQNNDAEKIITLDTWVRDLEPNHEYLLQRAVDAINIVDGNCTSTAWLTLGEGLTAKSISTNEKGTGNEELWRSVATLPSGSAFDIHFRVVDADNMNVVLTSDCYKYVIR